MRAQAVAYQRKAQRALMLSHLIKSNDEVRRRRDRFRTRFARYRNLSARPIFALSSATPAQHAHLETNMHLNAPVPNTKSFIYIVLMTACALLAGPLQAKELAVTLKVNTAGLKIGQPAGGRELYSRLKHAAAIVCGNGSQVGLQVVESLVGCKEAALGEAVRSANLPQLTVAYLGEHTLQQAATHGIEVPGVLIASK
jgi:UrcA family protein